MEIKYQKTVPVKGEYDVVVAGGGVAGCAAALSAARLGKKVILIEKTVSLGGLATIGLINFFVPMCNARGKQIIYGMCEEFFNLSIKYGYDTVPEDWVNGEPKKETSQRKITNYDAPMFSLVLLKLLEDAGVTVCFDTIITEAVMNGGHCDAVIVENKSGTSCYKGRAFVDATGDADLLARAGVPTVTGENYHTYIAHGTNLAACAAAAEGQDIAKSVKCYTPKVCADLYGNSHPESICKYNATDADDVNRYLVSSQLELFENLAGDERRSRRLTMLPGMAQFRTSRRIDGDYTFTVESDAYRHFDDSVCAICDFDRRDFLYEVPYRVMVKTGYDNIIAAGRCTSGSGYGWDVLRVIPVAILTGQVSGIACSQMLDSGADICGVDISALQAELERENVKIHFDDDLIPEVIESVRVDVGEM